MVKKIVCSPPEDLEAEILKWGGEEVSALDVYTDIFRLGEGVIQKKDEPPESRAKEVDLKTNPIGLFQYPYVTVDGKDRHHWRRRVLFEDTFEDLLRMLQEKDFAVIGGLSYFGRTNSLKKANKLHAFIFDLDSQNVTTIRNFLSGAIRGEAYPVPNYIALSGHGVHLYYVMEYPIPLYPDIKKRVNDLKKQLTRQIWNGLTTLEEGTQIQSINQGFRVIGGKTKIKGFRVKAFRIWGKHHNLKSLSTWVDKQYRIDDDNLFEIWTKEKKPNKLTLKEAMAKYPEWYETQVKPHEESQKHAKVKKRREVVNKGWRVKGDRLYTWWLEQIKKGATYKHRHNCIQVLAAMAIKSNPEDVPYERLVKDAYELMPFLNSLQPDDPFTEEDVEHALTSYSTDYLELSLNGIEEATGIKIPRRNRRHKKQVWHLEDIREDKQKMKERGIAFKNPEGRPSKEDEIKEFIKTNPDKNVTEIARELGVSRTTVYKYMTKE